MAQLQARFQLVLTGFELDVDFAIPAQGVTALFGPSGSGKTTLLRCLAGLERAAGHCRLQDLRWQDEQHFLPPHQRQLGYVFQEANLFPHLSVRANLEYGYRRIPAAQRRVQLDQVVAWLGLEPLLTRQQVTHLSGGERQRVAIGRALLTSPRLLLMDEPLAALDVASKQDILPYLERLHRELDIPLLYVSHALEEVLRLADHLLLLTRGRVLANGPLPDLLARLDLPLARLDDAGVVLQACVQQHDAYYQLSQLQCDGHGLWLNRVPQAPGEMVRVRILARDVSIATHAPQGSSISNILSCRIVAICDEGADKILLRLTLGQQSLLARITRRSHDLLALQVGMAVFAQIKSVALMA